MEWAHVHMVYECLLNFSQMVSSGHYGLSPVSARTIAQLLKTRQLAKDDDDKEALYSFRSVNRA